MSVPKGRRTQSTVEYFNNAYKLVEMITKYLISDFGTKKTYNNLYVFAHKAHMSDEDTDTFNNLVNQYHLETETGYCYWLLEYYRDRMLNIMSNMISHISSAHTMYPNSVYEFNIRRQYQTDAISDCYDLKHTLQLAIKIFPVNLEKYIPYVEMIDKEINLIKEWRKECNKFKHGCYENDERLKRNAITHMYSKELTAKEFKMPNITFEKLMDNMKTVKFNQKRKGYDNMPNKYIPAFVMCDNNGNIIGDSYTGMQDKPKNITNK